MIRRLIRAFTVIEILICIAIMAIAILIAFQTTIALNRDYRVIISRLGSLLKSREIVDIVSKDCRMAVRMMDSYSGYTASNSCLVLKVPSVDASVDIIDVNTEFDYIIYHINNKDLWKVVIPGAASARQPFNNVLKRSVDSMYATYNTVPLSSVPHKSVITHITLWFSVSETILGKEYAVTPGTTVKLMNYESGSVR